MDPRLDFQFNTWLLKFLYCITNVRGHQTSMLFFTENILLSHPIFKKCFLFYNPLPMKETCVGLLLKCEVKEGLILHVLHM